MEVDNQPGDHEYDEYLTKERREIEAIASDPGQHPEFTHFPVGLLFPFVPVPQSTQPPPEYVYVPPLAAGRTRDDALKHDLAVGSWNLMWEAGSLRYDLFKTELPPELRWLEDHKHRNLMLLPMDGGDLLASAPLFHLLSKTTLNRFGLSATRRGAFPPLRLGDAFGTFPQDASDRLARAFAHHVWPSLCSGSSLDAFAKGEPLRLLAHNLDFWIPYAHELVHDWMRALPRFPVKTLEAREQRRLRRIRRDVPPGVRVETSRLGGILWKGADEAREATRALVEVADRNGTLRGIIDAIRSNRVADDFSSRWSYAKEDFERKLFRKRTKTRVTFVELSDTIPCHSPHSEVDADLMWGDVFATLDAKERQIVVCLRSGTTQVGEIAKQLGYANHSPVSKRLRAIRRKAAAVLGIDD